MEVKAFHKNARISPRKVRMVRGVVRGLPVDEALVQLKFLPGKASQLLFKVLASAVANAVNTHGLTKQDLVVADVVVDGGFTMPRFRPVSRGRAFPFRKRTAHITVVVEPVSVILPDNTPSPSLPLRKGQGV